MIGAPRAGSVLMPVSQQAVYLRKLPSRSTTTRIDEGTNQIQRMVWRVSY
jgi:hypothetical protein